jgi:hypothetical protein
MVIGKKSWVFADGDLPPMPEGVDGPKAHEALMVVNNGEEEAKLSITLLFENDDPKDDLSLVVPPKRVKCFRMDQPIWGSDYVIPFGQYALIMESNVPVVAVFGRLDRRAGMSYYSVAPFAE